MCDCKKINNREVSEPYCIFGKPFDKWLPNVFFKDFSKNKLLQLFLKEITDSKKADTELFIRDWDDLLFYRSTIEEESKSTGIKNPYIISEDLLCKHDNLFLTVDQFNDLLTLIRLTDSAGIIKYLKKLEFYY